MKKKTTPQQHLLLYIILYAIIPVVGLCLSCSSPDIAPLAVEEDKSIKYIIPAGSHSTLQSTLQPLDADHITFKALFDSSAIYKTISTVNQEDINKLYGVSDCGSLHQVNSARFGWRWYKGKLEIWAYSYANSIRKFTFVDTIDLNIYATYEIIFNDKNYMFKVGNKTVVLPRECTGKATGYKLYPYFGGDETAPHQITIRIEDIP